MKSTRIVALVGVAAIALASGPAAAQEAAPAPASGLQVGPATIAPHWSKYQYPQTIGEGVSYYVIERGDTLWDLSQRYLGNPYLWPQVWNANSYVTDAHWIYPGDPLVFPKVALVSPEAGAPTGPGVGIPDEEAPGAEPGAAQPGQAASVLYPVTEEMAIQCAPYVAPEREDEGLYVIGSEQGSEKVAFADRDMLYLNRGSNTGVRSGDVYSLLQASYRVRHPVTGKKLGYKIDPVGRGRVVLVTEDSAVLVIEEACTEMYAGTTYLKPYEKKNVPLALRRPFSDRLTPPSGKAGGYVIDIAGNADIAATNHMVVIDVGSQDGVAPGNLLSVYRVMYPSVPTPRHVVGELAVVAVQDTTATAKVLNARDSIMAGDQVELR